MARTALVSHPAFGSGVLSPVVSLVVKFGNLMISIGERSTLMREVNRLNDLSDEDLAARGLSREGEVRRIFAGQFYI